MKPLFAVLALLPAFAVAQAEPIRVSLDARGDDVREVLATLFAQAHRPYALDASIKGRLYVAFDRVPYAKALGIVLSQAGLVAREQDGVTMVLPAPALSPPGVRGNDPQKPTFGKPLGPPTPTAVAKRPDLSPSIFAHRVTTRLTRAPLAEVLNALSEQAGVEIVLEPDVPAYRVDAFFVKSSFGYALDRVCKAARLRYAIEGNRVAVSVKRMKPDRAAL